MERIRSEIPGELTDKAAEALFCMPKEISVLMDDSCDPRAVLAATDYGLSFDCPENELYKWNKDYQATQKELAYIVKQQARSVKKSVDLLREKVKVALDNAAPSEPLRTYHNCEICVLRNGKGSRDGIEIPKERPTRYVPSRPAEEEEPRAIQRPAAPISVPSAVAAEEPEETGEKSEHRRRRSRGGRRSGGEKSKTAAPEKQEKQEKKPEKPKAEKQEKPEKKAENSRGRNARGDKAPRGEKQPRGDKPAKTEKQPKAEREPKVEKVAVRSNSDTTAEKKAAADRAARQQSGEAKAGEGKSGEHKPHRRRHHHRPRSKGQGGGQGSAE